MTVWLLEGLGGALVNLFIAVILSQMPKGNCYCKSSNACENR